MNAVTYQEAIEYINGVRWLGSKPGLERITELLGRLGAPQKKLKFVHIAGTSGKGSCAAMTASVLRAAGYRTGKSVHFPLTRKETAAGLSVSACPGQRRKTLTSSVTSGPTRMP